MIASTQGCFVLRNLAFHPIDPPNREVPVVGAVEMVSDMLKNFPDVETHVKACELLRNLAKDAVNHQVLYDNILKQLVDGTRSYNFAPEDGDSWIPFFSTIKNLSTHNHTVEYCMTHQIEHAGLPEGRGSVLNIIWHTLTEYRGIDHEDQQETGLSTVASLVHGGADKHVVFELGILDLIEKAMKAYPHSDRVHTAAIVTMNTLIAPQTRECFTASKVVALIHLGFRSHPDNASVQQSAIGVIANLICNDAVAKEQVVGAGTLTLICHSRVIPLN